MSTAEQPLLSPVDKVIAEISTAMHQWSEEQVTTIGDKVRARLEAHRDEVLMKLMGFDRDNFSRGWKIDHSNGRAGNSNISDFLKESQGAAVTEWISQIKLPKMSPAFKARIEKQLKNDYEREISSKVWTMAKNKAEKDLNELLSTVLAPTLVDKHLRMQELINPPNTNKTA